MRVLLIDEDAKSKIKAVREFAENPRNYYIRSHPPLFSERNGYSRHIHIGAWSFLILKREQAAGGSAAAKRGDAT